MVSIRTGRLDLFIWVLIGGRFMQWGFFGRGTTMTILRQIVHLVFRGTHGTIFRIAEGH